MQCPGWVGRSEKFGLAQADLGTRGYDVVRLLGLWSYIGEVRSTAEGDLGWIHSPELIRLFTLATRARTNPYGTLLYASAPFESNRRSRRSYRTALSLLSVSCMETSSWEIGDTCKQSTGTAVHIPYSQSSAGHLRVQLYFCTVPDLRLRFLKS